MVEKRALWGLGRPAGRERGHLFWPKHGRLGQIWNLFMYVYALYHYLYIYIYSFIFISIFIFIFIYIYIYIYIYSNVYVYVYIFIYIYIYIYIYVNININIYIYIYICKDTKCMDTWLFMDSRQITLNLEDGASKVPACDPGSATCPPPQRSWGELSKKEIVKRIEK